MNIKLYEKFVEKIRYLVDLMKLAENEKLVRMLFK